MRRTLGIILCAASTTLAGAARAESPVGRVYGDAAVGDPADAAAEAAAVEKRCAFNVMSRRGPDPSEVEACEGAVARLERRGPEAAAAIFAVLDHDRAGWHAKQRLYHALARTHDARAIEPLIRGMARIATRKLGERDWEIGMIDAALRELTRASAGERAPWEQAPVRAPHDDAVDQVIDWRLWHERHLGRSHEELAAERLADARAHAADPDAARAYQAVEYLLRYAPAEGAPAARALLDRADLPTAGRPPLEQAAEQADRDTAAAAQPLAPEVSPKRSKSAPPAPKRAPAKSPVKKTGPPTS